MLTIYYDEDCPFCSRYVRYVRIKQSVGEVCLVNVRADQAAQQSLSAMGFDLDEGMVAEYEGQFYSGDRAVQLLALLSSRSNFFNRINARLFASKSLSALLYPVLRAGRNTTLFFLGRPPISPDKSALDNLHIFAFTLGIFSIYHFIIYGTQYHTPMYPTTFLNLFLGVMLVLHPTSKRLLVLLFGSLLIDGILHAPVPSNHSIIKNFLLIGIALVGFRHVFLIKKTSWKQFYQEFAPLGRMLLLTMYFFGIFHKINSDFINPSSSCAVALLEKMYGFSYLAGHLWAQYMAIYSTFIIEGLVMLCLIIPRLRYYGIVGGVAFHMLLAASSYQFYPTFSTISILLHVLFLPPTALEKFRQTSLGQYVLKPDMLRRNVLAVVTLIVVQLAIILLAQDLSGALWVWFLWAIPFLLFIIQCAHEPPSPRVKNYFLSKSMAANIMALLFIVNCFSPYLGIKTMQSINMFANLHLEQGRSNHLLMVTPLFADSPMHDVVELVSVNNPKSFLSYAMQHQTGFVYYALLSHLDRNRQLKVSYIRRGILYENQSYETLKPEIEQRLHPSWVRKWLHFNSVSLISPKPCSPYN